MMPNRFFYPLIMIVTSLSVTAGACVGARFQPSYAQPVTPSPLEPGRIQRYLPAGGNYYIDRLDFGQDRCYVIKGGIDGIALSCDYGNRITP